MTKLLEAFRWWRLGVSWRKAVQLANMKRKERYHRELGLLLALAVAYVVVARNDEATAVESAARDHAARVAAEANLAHCLNGGWFNSSVGVINCGRAL
jgi:hypothetical protein